jgi:hypothetical protein
MTCVAIRTAGGNQPPDFWLVEHRSCRPAPRLVQRFSKLLGEIRLFVGAQKARDRQLFSARYQKQPVNSEVFDLALVQLHPKRIQHPFAHAAEMTDLANPELGACYGHLLVSFRMAIIEPECPVQQQHVESTEPEYRPGAEHQKQHAGYEAHQPEQGHENQKTDMAERAMWRQRRRKDRGFKLVAVAGVHRAQYTEIMVKKPVRRGSAQARKMTGNMRAI